MAFGGALCPSSDSLVAPTAVYSIDFIDIFKVYQQFASRTRKFSSVFDFEIHLGLGETASFVAEILAGRSAVSIISTEEISRFRKFILKM
jgi:hypothetical protein